MANYTDKPLLSIKEVIYILGTASAVIFYYNRQEANTTRLESKLDKLAYIQDLDKQTNNAKFIDITEQLAELKKITKTVEMIRPEEPTISRKRR